MAGMICKQPNGLYCRFSTVVDTITDYNMTRQDYINLCIEKAKKEANDVLDNHLRSFEEMKGRFVPNNDTQEEFNALVKIMETKKCRVCGCTDDKACPGGCHWVEDDLCNRCKS